MSTGAAFFFRRHNVYVYVYVAGGWFSIFGTGCLVSRVMNYVHTCRLSRARLYV